MDTEDAQDIWANLRVEIIVTKYHESSLESLLREDGIDLPAGSAQVVIRCFSPHHADRNPSMSVDLVQGLYHCHGCGISGNAKTYLTQIRGVSDKDAVAKLTDGGWTDEKLKLADKLHEERKRKRAGRPKWTQDISESLGGDTKLIATHDYCLEDGTLVLRMARYSKNTVKLDPEGNVAKIPKLLPHTPASNQQGEPWGWWKCGPTNEGLPDVDRRVDTKMPLYRLPDLLTKIGENPQRQVWIVEGEKCVDAVLSLKNAPPCTSVYGAVSKADLQILDGRNLLLIADSDQSGRKKMQDLASMLAREYGCDIRICLPKADDRYDVADAIADGGAPSLKQWIKTQGITTWAEADPERQEIPLPPMADTEYFKVMGIYDDCILFRIKKTSEILTYRSGMIGQEGTLIRLAPLSWWQEQNGGAFDRKMRAVVHDAIIRAAEKIGIVNPFVSFLGRGASFGSDDKIVWNLGNKVIAQGESGLLDKQVEYSDCQDVYTSGPKIELADDPNASEYAKDLCRAVLRYKWVRKEFGQVFLGWIVTSLVGGVLPFRPNLWILGVAGSGKTWIMNTVLKGVLQDVLHEFTSGSEAGIAHTLKSDSLPVYYDEFKFSIQKDAELKELLRLVRMATSGGGKRVRAGTAPTSAVHPRFSMVAGSVDRNALDSQDSQRFIPLRLTAKGVPDWPSIEQLIKHATSKRRGLAIRTWIIRNTPNILMMQKKLEREALESGMQTRLAQQMSALTAGYRFLSGDKDAPLVHIQSSRIDDQYLVLEALLTVKLRRQGENDTSLIDALMQVYFDANGRWIPEAVRKEKWGDLLQWSKQRGMMLEWPDKESGSATGPLVMYIAHRTSELKKLLRGTPHEVVELPEYLGTLPGACLQDARGKSLRKYLGGMQNVVVRIPAQTLQDLGIVDHEGRPLRD